jgi:hypothetical protein
MAQSKTDILQLLASGVYHAVQRMDDRSGDDIRLRREDGVRAEIDNYPYRVNQIPAYMFDEFLRDGLIHEDGTDDQGGKIFRSTDKARKKLSRAA